MTTTAWRASHRRFQAEQSNALCHFDMSLSDLKQLAVPPCADSGKPD
jgi:hypothetical protein